MQRFILLIGWILLAQPALAGGKVLWLTEEDPSQKARERAEKLTEVTEHLSIADLNCVPQSVDEQVSAQYEALRAAVAAGKARWEEFEVEYVIATELQPTLEAVSMVRDERDLDDLIQAKLLQGEAVVRAFSDVEFLEDERAEPFRVALSQAEGEFSNRTVVRPWVEAIMLAPGRVWTRSDISDDWSYTQFQEIKGWLEEVPTAALDRSMVPTEETLVVNGRPYGDQLLRKVGVGVHFVHRVRNEAVCGIERVTAAPGQLIELGMGLAADDLEQALQQVMAGTTIGFPGTVKAALEALAEAANAPIYVAAEDEGHVAILAYARGAKLLDQQVVTVMRIGELGPAVVVSPLFDQEGEVIAAVHAGVGLEIGIYNAVVLMGADIALTPGYTMTYGQDEGEPDLWTSALPQVWGGLGAYLVRPKGRTPTFLLAGTYGWDGPAHMTFGGRASLGLPMKRTGRWVRMTLGGRGGATSRWDVDDEQKGLYVVFARFGFGALN